MIEGIDPKMVNETVIELIVVPGEESDPEMLQFDWYTIEVRKFEIDLQLVFEHPLYVSRYRDDEDEIRIRFIQP